MVDRYGEFKYLKQTQKLPIQDIGEQNVGLVFWIYRSKSQRKHYQYDRNQEEFLNYIVHSFLEKIGAFYHKGLEKDM